MAIADIMTALRRQTSRLLRSDRGNLTLIGTLAAIPIVGAAGMAIDYARLSRVQDEIQLATDSATLFAAGAKTLGGTNLDKRATRQRLANRYLDYALSNITDAEIIGSPTVVADDVAINVEVKARVKGSFTNVFALLEGDAEMEQGIGGNEAGSNGKSYGITVKSKASWKKPVKYICLLALDPSAPNSLQVQGTADIDAKACAVQVNSTSSDALYQNGNATIKAASIDVVGNVRGSSSAFTPQPSLGGNPFPDTAIRTKFLSDYNTAWASSVSRFAPSGGAKTTIQPGRYPGFRITNGGEITMAPGVYFIVGGQLEVRSGGILRAPAGVTIIFTESTAHTATLPINSAARLTIQSGAVFEIKAPVDGQPFASIAVAQHPNTRTPLTQSNANNIQGGGIVNITGIVYYPEQILYVTGNGSISQNVPMFSIIARRIYIEGNGQLYIGQSADFEAAGFPALPSTGNTDNKISLQ